MQNNTNYTLQDFALALQSNTEPRYIEIRGANLRFIQIDGKWYEQILTKRM